MEDSRGERQRGDLVPSLTLGLVPPFWIISDTHFGHRNIVGYTGRPEGVEDLIVRRWQELVGTDDTVVHLGDLDFGHRRSFDLESLVASLPGRMFLLRGNHDRHKDATYTRLGITTIPPFILPWRGWTVAFTHWPRRDFVDSPRHLNVHGHIHDRLIGDLRLINAAVEWTGYAPVRVDDLLAVRTAALERPDAPPISFRAWATYARWCAWKYGGGEMRSDESRFSDPVARATARATYSAYREDLLARALAPIATHDNGKAEEGYG